MYTFSLRKHRFVCEEHAESGRLGLRFASQPGFDPLGGIAVAHDILEHFPDTTDSPADELQALGAELFVRGDNGYWRHKGSCQEPARHMCASVPGVVRHILFRNRALPPAPPCNLSVDGAATFDRHVLKFKIAFQHYVKREDFEGRDVNEYLNDIVGWIKFGYHRAGRRFRKLDGQALILCSAKSRSRPSNCSSPPTLGRSWKCR